MAAGCTDVAQTPINGVTITSGASETSSEIDVGAGVIPEDIFLLVEVAGFANVPTGNKRVTVSIGPISATGGNAHFDSGSDFVFSATANQTYRWKALSAQIPRYFKVRVTNDAGVDTASGAVTVKMLWRAVTL